MRLNLPRHNCVHFEIVSEFTVPSDADADIQAFMDRTATHFHDLDDTTRVSIFGSISMVGGAKHQVVGRLRRTVSKDDEISYRLSIVNHKAPDELPRPPVGMRRVSHLIDASSGLLGRIDATCIAVFEYVDSAYRSNVHFPIPLIVQSDQAGLTHVEEAQFSRRVNDEIDYRISVSQGSSSIKHSVEFDTAIQLNNRNISQLLNRAGRISLQLVTRNSE